MNRTIVARLVAGAALSASCFASGGAAAGDFRLELATTGAGTEWRGDAAAYGSLELGYRFIDLIGLYVGAQEGYASVDQRLLTLVTVGAQIWGRIGPTRPYARLAFVHQHEESLTVVSDDPGSALLGIGDGIRHRAGGELGLGLDLPLYEKDALTLFGTVEGSAKLFPDDRGPKVYAGGGLGLGMSYFIEGAP